MEKVGKGRYVWEKNKIKYNLGPSYMDEER